MLDHILPFYLMMIFIISCATYSLLAMEGSASQTSLRTQYDDDLGKDWILSGNNLDRFFNNTSYHSIINNVSHGGYFVDVTGVTYSINQHFLNASIILDSDIKSVSDKSNISFGMFVDSDFNTYSGINGWDFEVKMELKNNSLLKRLIEIFPSGELRERQSSNESRSLAIGDKSLDIYLDLNKINNPNRFGLMFYVSNSINVDNNRYLVSDATDWIVVPGHNINLEVNPAYLDINAGESKTVEYISNSSSKLLGVSSLFLNDQPISFLLPFVPERGFSLRDIPVCYSHNINSNLLQSVRFSTEEPYNDTSTLLYLSPIDTLDHNLTTYTTDNLTTYTTDGDFNQSVFSELNFGSIKGIEVTRSYSLDDFSLFDSHYHQATIKTLENSTQELNYLTIRTNLYSSQPQYTLGDFYQSPSVFGNETFYSCAPKYARENLGFVEKDVRINVLPPKDLLQKLNDFLKKYDVLTTFFVTFVAAFLSGGYIFTRARKSGKLQSSKSFKRLFRRGKRRDESRH